MILILEGPDGGGKTTLANKLSEQTGYPIIHRSQPKTEADKAAMKQEYIDMIKNTKNFILDRCWYSELAYGPVMRDASVITYPQMYELEKMLVKSGALLIYCTAPVDVLWKRATRRGEDYVTSKDNFKQICKNYSDIMDMPHYIPVVKYSVEGV